MTSLDLTRYNQSPTIKTREIKKNVSTLSKHSTNGVPNSSSNKSDYEAMAQKQEMLNETDLAPDWVWEYGIMG